jgi:carboxyl-terminal processing protease
MRRILLLFLVISASGCTEALVAPKIDSSPPAVFGELWNEFNLRYATFPERHVNWDSLHTLYATRITSNMPDSTLLHYCDSLLAPLRDGHVRISTGTEGYGYVHTDSTYQFDFDQVSYYYLGETANESSDGTIRCGLIHDSIGYMNVTTFDLTDDDYWGTEIDAILDTLQNTKALIVDLRGNGGGAAGAAQTLGSRFIPVGITIGYNQARYDANFTDLSAPNPVTSDISHSPLWTKPIVLLTNRETMSAAEWVTMGARTQPNVTIIGDTTQGAFSDRLDRQLSNGWQYSMSFLKGSDANHVCHEGIGLIPDIEIYVKENQQVDSPDTVLDRAIEFLTK